MSLKADGRSDLGGDLLESTPPVGPDIIASAGTSLDRSWRTWYSLALLAADALAAVAATVFAYVARGHQVRVNVFNWQMTFTVLAGCSLLLWLLANLLHGSYRPTYTTEQLADYRAPITVGLRLMALVALAAFALHVGLSRLLVVVYFPSLIVCAIALRWTVRYQLGVIRRRGRARVRLILAGDAVSVLSLANHLFRTANHGYQLVGVCIPGTQTSLRYRDHTVPVLGPPDSVDTAARAAGIHVVAVANPNRFETMSLQRLAWRLERSHIELLVAPDVAEAAGPRIRVAPVSGIPLLHITEPRIDTMARRSVALVSRIVALPLLLLICPLLAVIAVAIAVDSRGPVFYRQERIGYRRRPFRMIKFRTMVRHADQLLDTLLPLNDHDGALFKMRHDPRVTRVGRILRRYSLDELPQMFNVVLGQMVFVGPRPVLAREMAEFGEPEERRFFAKPGMTGLWQVSGRTDLPWDEAVKLDLYYVENWTPVLDALILCRTLRTVFSGTGY